MNTLRIVISNCNKKTFFLKIKYRCWLKLFSLHTIMLFDPQITTKIYSVFGFPFSHPQHTLISKLSLTYLYVQWFENSYSKKSKYTLNLWIESYIILVTSLSPFFIKKKSFQKTRWIVIWVKLKEHGFLPFFFFFLFFKYDDTPRSLFWPWPLKT